MAGSRRLRRIFRAEEGVTAIEFAFVAPVLLLLMFGIIEFGLIMTVMQVMESATSSSARLGRTGFVEANTTRTQTILNAVSKRAGSMIDPKKIVITAKFYKQYDQINDPEPYVDSNHNGSHDAGEHYTDINGNGQWDSDMGISGYGSAGDVVVYKVTYPWTVITPIMGRVIGKNGVLTLSASAVVKNEPY